MPWCQIATIFFKICIFNHGCSLQAVIHAKLLFYICRRHTYNKSNSTRLLQQLKYCYAVDLKRKFLFEINKISCPAVIYNINETLTSKYISILI